MKTFLLDLIPKLQQFSTKLDDTTLLANQHWVAIDDIGINKIIYIFRGNNELLISNNGKVEKAKWEYLGNRSLLIDKVNESFLFKHGFLDENVMALKIDSSNEYAVFVNENKYEGELNSIERVIDFLKRTYLQPGIKKQIEAQTKSNFQKESEFSYIKDKVNETTQLYKFVIYLLLLIALSFVIVAILSGIIEEN
ncbi:MAG: hypothetical protein R2821_03830 [Flavobacteriaceae bacterium]|nr:hypothetical protein [Ignavibacteriota bacterium]